LLGREGQRHPQAVLVPVGRAGAEHADNRVRCAVDTDVAADDLRISSKALLPQAMAEDDNLVLAGRAFFLDKRAAQRERVPVTVHREQPRGRRTDLHLLRPVIGRQVHLPPTPRVDFRESRGLLFPVDKIGR
jgi:hypothetical protein